MNMMKRWKWNTAVCLLQGIGVAGIVFAARGGFVGRSDEAMVFDTLIICAAFAILSMLFALASFLITSAAGGSPAAIPSVLFIFTVLFFASTGASAGLYGIKSLTFVTFAVALVSFSAILAMLLRIDIRDMQERVLLHVDIQGVQK